MKGHRTYIVTCRDAQCRASYEVFAKSAVNTEALRAVRCPWCQFSVKVEALGITGEWQAQRAHRMTPTTQEIRGKVAVAGVGGR